MTNEKDLQEFEKVDVLTKDEDENFLIGRFLDEEGKKEFELIPDKNE